jgi:hypothetical protein
MGFVLPLDILSDVSYVLIEPVVDTTVLAITGAPGFASITIGGTTSLYPGAVVVIGRGTPNLELITVVSVAPLDPFQHTVFTAVCANSHAVGAALNGATFPSGLFTQQEMLEYLYNAENEFLLKVRPVFAQAMQALDVHRYYPQPADAIRIERISSSEKAWTNTSQLSLDQDNPNWQADHESDDPRAWFQDEIGLDQFGIWPMVDIGGVVAQIWYSQKDTNSAMSFLTPFLLPDIFTMYLKYAVLARAFSKDGEQRDDLRAKFCQKRLDFGVMLSRMFLFASETLATELELDQGQMQRFQPMVLSGGK